MDSDSGSDSDSVGIHNASSIEGDFLEEEISDESSVDSGYSDETVLAVDVFDAQVRRIKNNDPNFTKFFVKSYNDLGPNVTDEQWEEIGRDVSNNTHLKSIALLNVTFSDRPMSYLFRGLTGSSSIQSLSMKSIPFSRINFTEAGVRSMVPFLQNANNLKHLHLDYNTMRSEGFNFLLRTLRDSPIENLGCIGCDIESIEINIDCFPRNLKYLGLVDNNIKAGGCREIAKLLRGAHSTLQYLRLNGSGINDEGVAILIDALRNNTSLGRLSLFRNREISKKGKVMLLKLVNDISSAKATLESNHTLTQIEVDIDHEDEKMESIWEYIGMATSINRNNASWYPEVAGREKVIQTQLHSETRAELAELQGVSQSVWSDINPLHLPEVLSLVGHRQGPGELHFALKSTILELISAMNRKACLKQCRAYHAAKSAEMRAQLAAHTARLRDLDAELAAIEGDAGPIESDESQESTHRVKKRRRKWWWGLWGGE